MKYLFLAVAFMASFNSKAQEPVGAIESVELNVLYRGYPNIIIPAVSNNEGKRITVSVQNASIGRKDSNLYIVKPGKGKACYITLSLVDDETGISEVVRRAEYRVQNLPDPTIYWGGVRNGGKASVKQSRFFAKYPPQVPLSAQFKIMTWKFAFENDSLHGRGSNIAAAEEVLKKVPTGTILNFEFTVLGGDGILRKLMGSWKVTSWEEEYDGPVIIID